MPAAFSTACPTCLGRAARATEDADFGHRDADTCSDCDGTGELLDFTAPLTDEAKSALRWLVLEAGDEFTLDRCRAHIRTVWGPGVLLELRRRLERSAPAVPVQ